MAIDQLTGKERVSALFEDYVAHAGKWTQGYIYREVTNSKMHKAQGVRKWLTRLQLLQHYTEDQVLSCFSCTNHVVDYSRVALKIRKCPQVEEIVLRKEADPDLCLTQVREHPELRGNSAEVMNGISQFIGYNPLCAFPAILPPMQPELIDLGVTQYLTLVEDMEISANETTVRDLFQLKSDLKDDDSSSSTAGDSASAKVDTWTASNILKGIQFKSQRASFNPRRFRV